MPSDVVTREYSVPVAATTMWEIETNSVGNSLTQAAVPPAHQDYVASPQRGIDRTQGFASTKLRRRTVLRLGMLGSRGPDRWIGLAEHRRVSETGFVAPIGYTPGATKPIRQRFSSSDRRQAISGGSGSPVASDP